jgi:hypothetical protein
MLFILKALLILAKHNGAIDLSRLDAEPNDPSRV